MARFMLHALNFSRVEASKISKQQDLYKILRASFINLKDIPLWNTIHGNPSYPPKSYPPEK